MPTIRTAVFAAAVAAGFAGAAAGQDNGSNTTSTGGGNSTSSSGGTNNLANTVAFQAPVIGGQSLAEGGTVTGGFLSPSNVFGRFSANPYYAGRAGATLTEGPGGFGTSLYPATGNGAGSTSNVFSAAAGSGPFSSAGGFGGNTGTNRANQFGGAGGRTGVGQFGQQGGGNQQRQGGNQRAGQGFGGQGFNTGAGVIVPLPRAIAYTAKLNFAPPAVSATQVVADLRGMIDRTGMLTTPGTIDVFTDGTVVVLRGTVPTAEEAQTAEGMVRLTPGVRDVKNELRVAAAGGTPAPTP